MFNFYIVCCNGKVLSRTATMGTHSLAKHHNRQLISTTHTNQWLISVTLHHSTNHLLLSEAIGRVLKMNTIFRTMSCFSDHLQTFTMVAMGQKLWLNTAILFRREHRNDETPTRIFGINNFVIDCWSDKTSCRSMDPLHKNISLFHIPLGLHLPVYDKNWFPT